MSSPAPDALDALKALADVASVYEQCNSIAGLMQSPPAASIAQQQPPPSHDTAATSTTRPPAASRPAKKRPVPMELTQLSPVPPPALPPIHLKKTKLSPKTDSAESKMPQPTATTNKPKRKTRKSRRKSSISSTPSFPAILMGMLSTPQNSQYITFLPDGRRFVILDSAAFEQNLLPLHFQPTDKNLYWNFTRMLEEWDFKSETCEEYVDKDVYSHPLFKEGDWEGCLKISKRQDVAEKSDSPLLKPLGMPSSQKVEEKVPSLATLNASLSKQMSATETSRVLCNLYGLLDSSKLHGLMGAHPHQAPQSQDAALRALMMQASQQPQGSQEAALQAMLSQIQQSQASQDANTASSLMMASQQQQSQEAALQAILAQQDPSSLQAMMASHADLQSLMAAQQARSRLLSAVTEAFQDPNSKPRTISPEFSQALLGNQANLDVMTERFIRQSMERMMGRQIALSQMGQQQGFGP